VKNIYFPSSPIIIIAPSLAYAVKAKPYGWPSASLDRARCGADFLFEVGRKKGNFLFPFSFHNFFFAQGRVWSRASPQGAACAKGAGRNERSE